MVSLTEREKRLALHLPVELDGEDASGVSFSESTRTVNLSGGGVCFETRHPLLVGARVRLLIALPPPLRRHFGGRESYEARAVVCRVEHVEGHPIARVGARFLREG